MSTAVSLVGGLLGGMFIVGSASSASLLILALCMNVPHLCYVYPEPQRVARAPALAHDDPLLVTIEKFGYSFGFVGNMLYMMQQIAPGKYKMTHYAFARR